MFTQHTRVKVTSNRYAEQGVPANACGYILEIYADGNIEVEFSDSSTGISFAQIIIDPKDLINAPEPLAGC